MKIEKTVSEAMQEALDKCRKIGYFRQEDRGGLLSGYYHFNDDRETFTVECSNGHFTVQLVEKFI